MLCPSCKSDAVVFTEGCQTCQSCGWSLCDATSHGKIPLTQRNTRNRPERLSEEAPQGVDFFEETTNLPSSSPPPQNGFESPKRW